jgi:hypothetical protein
MPAPIGATPTTSVRAGSNGGGRIKIGRADISRTAGQPQLRQAAFGRPIHQALCGFGQIGQRHIAQEQ